MTNYQKFILKESVLFHANPNYNFISKTFPKTWTSKFKGMTRIVHGRVDLLTSFDRRAQTFKVIVGLSTDYHGHAQKTFFDPSGHFQTFIQKCLKNASGTIKMNWNETYLSLSLHLIKNCYLIYFPFTRSNQTSLSATKWQKPSKSSRPNFHSIEKLPLQFLLFQLRRSFLPLAHFALQR